MFREKNLYNNKEIYHEVDLLVATNKVMGLLCK